MSPSKSAHTSSAISSPHSTRGDSVGKVMRMVIYCTIPGMATLMAFFGWGVFFQVWTCAFFCLASEAAVLILRGRDPRRELFDCSALLTGILLGLSLPPLAPWWIAVGGAVFAIVIAKQLYGGLGLNPFNPAMVAYVALLVAFPQAMTSWSPPLEQQAYNPGFFDSLALILTGTSFDGHTLTQLRTGLDGFTMATPLDTLKTDLSHGLMASETYLKPVFGAFAGYGWEWVNLAFMIGGFVLLARKLITPHIPFAILGSLFVSALIFHVWSSDEFGSPIFHWFSGGTMLAAFFIATDPVTASQTPKGKIIYGVAIGVLVYLIRNFGAYPDAFAFAILLMNLAAPMIDHYTPPRAYGLPKRKEVAVGNVPKQT